MSVADEDVAVGCDCHVGRRVELIHSRSGDAFFAECQQDLSVLTELEYLVPAIVGKPQVSISIDRQFVRADEHPRPEGLQQFAGRIKLEDWVDVRTCSAAGRAAGSGIAA